MSEIKTNVENVIRINFVVKRLIENADISNALKFRFLKIAKDIEPVVTSYETLRNELINKYGTADEDGNKVIKDDDVENREKFLKENATILSSDTTISCDLLSQEDVFNAKLDTDCLIGLFPLIEN